MSGSTLIQCSSFLSPALGGAALVICEIRLFNEQHVCTAQFGEPRACSARGLLFWIYKVVWVSFIILPFSSACFCSFRLEFTGKAGWILGLEWEYKERENVEYFILSVSSIVFFKGFSPALCCGQEKCAFLLSFSHLQLLEGSQSWKTELRHSKSNRTPWNPRIFWLRRDPQESHSPTPALLWQSSREEQGMVWNYLMDLK